jgi:hypothetical protein
MRYTSRRISRIELETLVLCIKPLSYVRKYRINVREVDNSGLLYSHPIFMTVLKLWEPLACNYYFYVDPKIMADRRSLHCMHADFG